MSERLSHERLEEIRERLDAAPSGVCECGWTYGPSGRCSMMCEKGRERAIHRRGLDWTGRAERYLRELLAEVDRLREDLAVAEGEAWSCQECFAVYPLSRKPIYGEYPEEGDVFCSEACLHANDARGDEACDPGVQP